MSLPKVAEGPFTIDPAHVGRALDSDTPPSWLGAAARRSLVLACAVALNPSATGGILEQIARRWPGLHAIVVRHPAVRRRLVARLAEAHPAGFFANPAAERLVRARRSLPARLLGVLLARDNAPAWLRRALMEHELPSLRALIARDAATDATLLARLSRDVLPAIRAHAAAHPSLPPSELPRLARDEASVRRAVAERPDTPAELQLALARDVDAAVRQAVAERIDDPAALAVLAREPLWTRERVASNPAASDDLLVELSRDESPWIRTRVATNPSTPERALANLLAHPPERSPWRDTHDLVLSHLNASLALFQRAAAGAIDERIRVARCATAPLSVLKQLCSDDDGGVRWHLAWHHGHRPELAAALARDRSSSVRSVLADKVRDPDVLTRLARDPEPYVRRAVAKSQHVSADTLARLARDSDMDVRVNVAMNARTPPDALRTLVRDRSELVRRWAILHPQLPFDLVLERFEGTVVSLYETEQLRRRLEQSPHELQRAEASENPRVRAVAAAATTDTSRLARLSRDPAPIVRAQVAPKSALLDLVIVERLATDRDPEVRRQLAAHVLDETTMRDLSADPDATVRAAIATNPAAPIDVLERLACDDDELAVGAVLVAHPEHAFALACARAAR